MMGIDSDFARVIAEGQDVPELTRDRQLAVLMTHARHTSKHLQALGEAVEEIRTVIVELKAMATAQQHELAANTQVTTHVRDTITAGRIATKVIQWVGIVAVAFGGVYAAVSVFFDAGPGPGSGGNNIGP